MRDTDSILCSPGDSLGGRGPVTKFSHPYRFSRRSDRQDPYSLLRPQSQVKHGYGFAIPSVHTTLTVTETRIHFHADFCAESTPTVQPSLTHRMPRVQTTTNPPSAPIPTRMHADKNEPMASAWLCGPCKRIQLAPPNRKSAHG